MTDYAAACFFFDFLMEGNLDSYTGKYTINNSPDEIDERSLNSSRFEGSLMDGEKDDKHQSSKNL